MRKHISLYGRDSAGICWMLWPINNINRVYFIQTTHTTFHKLYTNTIHNETFWPDWLSTRIYHLPSPTILNLGHFRNRLIVFFVGFACSCSSANAMLTYYQIKIMFGTCLWCPPNIFFCYSVCIPSQYLWFRFCLLVSHYVLSSSEMKCHRYG